MNMPYHKELLRSSVSLCFREFFVFRNKAKGVMTLLCQFEKMIYPSGTGAADAASFMIALYRPCEKLKDSIIESTSQLNFQRKKIFMKEFLPVIRSSQLFSGIAEEELVPMLSCLDARQEAFPKDAFLLRTGDTVGSVGIVLSGSIMIIQEDIWGNRNILSKAGQGQVYAAAFACAPGAVLNVSVVAETPVTVMLLNIRRVLTVCSSACEHHNRIIRNLLAELAEKNLLQNEKLTHMGQRTTRGKLMSYLSAEAQRLGRYEFDIPFSRQQLADYLAVERSGLSLELGKMQKDGLLEFHKNHFVLKL